MKKSTLGIPYGVLAAVLYISCLYSGALAVFLVAGYILLKEKEEWIRTQAVKVILLMLVFGVFTIVLGLIPDTIALLSSFVSIFGGSISIPFVSNIISFLTTAIIYIKNIVFLVLAYKSLSEKTVKIPFVDSIISKVASGEATEIRDLASDMKQDLDVVKDGLGKAKDNVINTVNEAKDKVAEKIDEKVANSENNE